MSQLQVTGEAKIRDIQGPVVANSGVITALDGAANQYVRGDGTLATFPTSGGGGSSVSYYLNGSVNQGTIGGVAYKELSKDPILGVGTDFTISANGYVASFITDANDPDSIIVPGGNWNTEIYFSVDSNSNSPYFYVEVYKYDGSTFTLLGSNQTTPEYITAGTTITPYYGAVAIPTTNTAITDRIAIRIYVVPDGRTVTLHTENSHLGQIVTTFSKGMTSLNNLTDQSQYLTTGTSGTNFAIISSGDTHTFNLPVASASNTGKLSSTDWSTFNNKVPYTGATADVDLGLYELSAQNAFLNGVSGVNGGNLFLKQGDDFGQSSGYTSLYSSGKNLGILSYVGSYTYNAFISLALIPNNETRSYILPNQSGTFALLDGAQTFTGANTFAGGVISIADSNAASYILRGRFTDDLAQIQFKNNAGTNTKAVISVSSVGTNGGGIQFLVKPQDLPIVSSLTLSPYQAHFDTSVTADGSFTGTSLRILNTIFTSTIGASLTANRTITIPDLTGTIALLEGTQTFSGSKTFSNTITFNDYALMNIGVALAKTSGTPLYASTNGYANLQLVNSGSVNSLYLNDGDTLKYAKLSFNNAADYTYTFPSASGTIALTSNLSAYVPYTGATGNVNLGTNTLTASTLIVDQGSTGTTLRFKQYGSASYNTNGYTDIYVVSNNIVGFGLNQGSGNFKGFSFNVVNVTTNQSRDLYIPDASGTIALTSDLSGYVTLGTTQTISGLKTFTALATNNEAVGIKLTSGVVSTGGYLTLNAKVVGTLHSLFLAPDSTTNRAEITFDNTALRTYALPNASGTIALTSNLSAYLPLTGGTLTGALSGTSATFSSSVTIGSTSAGANVNAYSSSYGSNGIFQGFGTDGAMKLQMGALGNAEAYIFANTGCKLSLFSGGSTTMTLSSGGNVGIGTSSPVVLLQGQISSTSNTDTEIFRLTDGVLCDFKIRLKRGTTSDNSTSVVNTYSGIMAFETGNTERMRITSGGDVGIGTSTIAFAAVNRKCLEVNGAGTSLIALKVADAAQGYIYSIGNNGDFYLARVGTGGNLIIQNNSGGAYLSPGATSWSAVSDIRLKNINSNIDNALDKLMTLSTINFSWKSDETKQENLGFIAQEVEKVFPQVITKVKINGNLDSKIEDDTEYLSVKYTDLIPVLVKAIQEQQAQIEELKELIKNK